MPIWKHVPSRGKPLLPSFGWGTVRPAMVGLGLIAGVVGWGQSAHATQIDARFGISIAGIPVGSGTVKASVNGRNYSIDGYAKTSGISRLFINSKGRAISKGRFRGAKSLPSMYALNSREDKIHNVVQIAMHSGNVSKFSASPPVSRHSDRIPLKRVHTRGIIDPMSGLLMSVKSKKHRVGKSVCDRTVRMFDGRWRYNFELFYKGTEEIRQSDGKGYVGPVTRCGARMRFVAGHRPNKKSTKFMENNKDIEAWFVPVGDDPVVAVYRLQVGTMVGRMVLEAKELEIN
ncbi:Protein of unknown function [Cohaesibacter sp. ES.047]|uniref:DUF3108 domain-containing protein n=1 Tax=Cohaesibacter sp. ES.047 TaxID=1798205 RepID=UPI000BB9611C|nr:DUF3108 domain-containing protein [Cohaesibacter sp. ES.047]SNY90868.1 Protein of unknown function [Cohaesibacter sp. ES.047]